MTEKQTNCGGCLLAERCGSTAATEEEQSRPPSQKSPRPPMENIHDGASSTGTVTCVMLLAIGLILLLAR